MLYQGETLQVHWLDNGIAEWFRTRSDADADTRE